MVLVLADVLLRGVDSTLDLLVVLMVGVLTKRPSPPADAGLIRSALIF